MVCGLDFYLANYDIREKHVQNSSLQEDLCFAKLSCTHTNTSRFHLGMGGGRSHRNRGVREWEAEMTSETEAESRQADVYNHNCFLEGFIVLMEQCDESPWKVIQSLTGTPAFSQAPHICAPFHAA